MCEAAKGKKERVERLAIAIREQGDERHIVFASLSKGLRLRKEALSNRQKA